MSKYLGLNLTSKPGHPLESAYLVEWDWLGWIRPQVDCAIALGCNIVRIIGDVAMVTRGDISQATYNTRMAELGAYLAANNVALYYTGAATYDTNGSNNGTVALPDATIAATIVSNFQATLASGVSIPFLDIVQEANGLSAARVNNIYSIVRPQITPGTLCTFSRADRMQDFVWQDSIMGSCDFIDLHIYPQLYGNNLPTAADVANVLARYPSKSVLFGEGGANRTQFSSVQVEGWITGFAALCSINDERVLGGALWAAQDQDQLYGAFDARWNPRPEIAGPWLKACRLGYLPVAANALVDSTGAVWTLGTPTQYGKQVLRNGVSAAGGQATLIVVVGATVKVQNSLGNWWLWTGNGWQATSAP